MKAGGRERRGALCKASSHVSVRVSGKGKWVLPVPLLNGNRTATIILVMLLFILPHWASPLSPLPVGLGCSPKPALDWCFSFKFVHTSSSPDTWPHHIKKKKKMPLSLCPFLLHSLRLCPCTDSESPCREMPSFLLTDSRGKSHWFTKLCFENQHLKWLVAVD